MIENPEIETVTIENTVTKTKVIYPNYGIICTTWFCAGVIITSAIFSHLSHVVTKEANEAMLNAVTFCLKH